MGIVLPGTRSLSIIILVWKNTKIIIFLSDLWNLLFINKAMLRVWKYYQWFNWNCTEKIRLRCALGQILDLKLLILKQWNRINSQIPLVVLYLWQLGIVWHENLIFMFFSWCNKIPQPITDLLAKQPNAIFILTFCLTDASPNPVCPPPPSPSPPPTFGIKMTGSYIFPEVSSDKPFFLLF